MQNPELFELPCSTHKDQALVCLCMSQNCNNRLLCPECIGIHPKDHGKESLFKILSGDLDALFQALLNENAERKSIFEKEIKNLETFISDIKKRFEEALLNLQAKAIDMIKSKLFKHEQQFDLDTLKSKLDKSKQALMDKNEIGKAHTNLQEFSTYYSLVHDFKKQQNNYDFDLKDYLTQSETFLRDVFSNKNGSFKNNEDVLIQPPWCWSDMNKSRKVLLLDKNLTIKKEGTESHSVVIGNKILDKGKHQWSLTFQTGHGSWIMAGVIASLNLEYLKKNAFEEGNIWNKCEAVANDGQIFNNVKSVSKINVISGTFKVSLDFDKDIIEFFLDETKIAEVKNIKNNTFYPVCIIKRSDNSIVLKHL